MQLGCEFPIGKESSKTIPSSFGRGVRSLPCSSHSVSSLLLPAPLLTTGAGIHRGKAFESGDGRKNSLDASDMQEAAPYGTLVLPQRAVLASLTVNNQSNRVHRVTD